MARASPRRSKYAVHATLRESTSEAEVSHTANSKAKHMLNSNTEWWQGFF